MARRGGRFVKRVNGGEKNKHGRIFFWAQKETEITNRNKKSLIGQVVQNSQVCNYLASHRRFEKNDRNQGFKSRLLLKVFNKTK